jgi:hypothetical protein
MHFTGLMILKIFLFQTKTAEHQQKYFIKFQHRNWGGGIVVDDIYIYIYDMIYDMMWRDVT